MKALVAMFVLMTVTAKTSFIRQSDLPHDRWVSLQRNVEFLPVVDESFEEQRQLRRLSSRRNNSPYSIHPFVEGESEYDEYQQAWRYLGFMIDCNDGGNDDDDGGGTGEGCHRYVVWAAYVDLDYEGGGIGEYQFWDRKKQRWDTTSCNGDQDNDGQSRCAKMDCHLEDTNWSLLGLFKHKSYGDWMEQLFKHEGFCVWSDEEYGFMKNARKTWPQGCSVSSTTTSNGSYIYYDLKPTSNGGMTFGLYTDTRCMEEYHGSFSLQDVLENILLEGGSHDSNDNSNYDTGGYTLAQSLATWDSIFDTWKICHPCVAYDLNNVGYNTDDDASKGSAYGTYRYGYDDDYNYANYGVEHGNDFDCYDDAAYTNVNQVSARDYVLIPGSMDSVRRALIHAPYSFSSA